MTVEPLKTKYDVERGRRGDLIEKRSVMMQWYSDYAYGKPAADNLSEIRA